MELNNFNKRIICATLLSTFTLIYMFQDGFLGFEIRFDNVILGLIILILFLLFGDFNSIIETIKGIAPHLDNVEIGGVKIKMKDAIKAAEKVKDEASDENQEKSEKLREDLQNIDEYGKIVLTLVKLRISAEKFSKRIQIAGSKKDGKRKRIRPISIFFLKLS